MLSDWLKDTTLTRHVGIQTSQQVLEPELLAFYGPLLCLPPRPLYERKQKRQNVSLFSFSWEHMYYATLISHTSKHIYL